MIWILVACVFFLFSPFCLIHSGHRSYYLASWGPEIWWAAFTQRAPSTVVLTFLLCVVVFVEKLRYVWQERWVMLPILIPTLKWCQQASQQWLLIYDTLKETYQLVSLQVSRSSDTLMASVTFRSCQTSLCNHIRSGCQNLGQTANVAKVSESQWKLFSAKIC